MGFRGGLVAALTGAAFLSGCVDMPGAPEPWDAAGHRAYLGVEEDDPWCVWTAYLRAHLDGDAPAPDAATREAALGQVRAEEETRAKAAGEAPDLYWPMRKALACEFVRAAEEEIAEIDWPNGIRLLTSAREAIFTPRPESGIGPILPVVDHLDGREPDSLEPVDFSTPAYCSSLKTSELALSQLRGGVVEAVGFPGSLQRAPDWFAHVQVAYHRWALEHLEGHQLYEDDTDFGGIPFHCRRFDAAYKGSEQFAIKDNLVFLIAERDDPNKAGRLVVTTIDGRKVVLDRVLAAAQLESGGSALEAVEFFPEDLAASAALTEVVRRANDLPPPKVFIVFFEYNETSPVEGEQSGTQALREYLEALDPNESARIAISGHADCVGPRWYNLLLAEQRIEGLTQEVILPALLKAGFTADLLASDQVKVSNAGESAPAARRDDPTKCVSRDIDRRVIVVVQ